MIQDLKEQTYTKFQHVFVSNGKSPLIERIIGKVNDLRFVYVEAPYEKTSGLVEILSNIAKRRNYCLENFEADRYFFFDADLYVKDSNFLQGIADIHNKADVIVSKIWMQLVPEITLPIHPIKRGNIDIANYSFSKNIRDKYKYPTDYPRLQEEGIGNDWRFYESLENESHYFNDTIYAIKDGRKLYRNLSTRYYFSKRLQWS